MRSSGKLEKNLNDHFGSHGVKRKKNKTISLEVVQNLNVSTSQENLQSQFLVFSTCLGQLSCGDLRTCGAPQQLVPYFLNMMEQIHHSLQRLCNQLQHFEMHDCWKLSALQELQGIPVNIYQSLNQANTAPHPNIMSYWTTFFLTKSYWTTCWHS